MTEPVGLADVIRRSTAYLERHGVESPAASVETLLMHLLEIDRARLYARREGLDTATARAFGRALCQRCTGVPLQHLTGEQPFLGLRLAVLPGVFVPRPETEGLVLAALRAVDGVEGPLVVDVGTGTGAVGLAIASRRADATVFATDTSDAAVALARSNAERLGLGVSVERGDLLEPVPKELRGRIDLIVSNPPYVRPEDYDALPVEVRGEPRDALVGGTEVHARLVEASAAWLRRGGWLVTEIGDDQGPQVRSIFRLGGLGGVEVLPDLAGRDRVVRGQLPL